MATWPLTEPAAAVTVMVDPAVAVEDFNEAVATPLASVVPCVMVRAPPALAEKDTDTPATATLAEFTTVAVIVDDVLPSLATDAALVVTAMLATDAVVPDPLPDSVLPPPPPHDANPINISTNGRIL
jgi:hypothetical protein